MDVEQLNVRLFRAVENSDIQSVEQVLKMGANINATKMLGGETPLIVATSGGDLTMMEFLLVHGAVLHQADANGNFAIHRATLLGHLDGVKLLVQRGSLTTLENNDFDTPLMIASVNGYTEIVEYLLSRGVPMMYKVNQKGRSELTLATEQGYDTIVKLLLNNGDPSKNRSDEINKALRLAVNKNNFEITRILLDWGADPNTRDMAGVPLIIYPLWRNNEPLLYQLLLKGADEERILSKFLLNLVKIWYNSLLFLPTGADLNALQTNGCATALSLAHIFKDSKILELIENTLKEE
ncbi:unnamed protein product [Hymenolepis diminuta]|uniref:ANK_REP_REGION domain-containing protein n=1 Tax=Hymenolepis diminuta TaxID=6216 RepID=A0A0R3SMB8_HYMDI|nr:unnamed protein product [Hymenolepis diminuta]